jgi:hypothetical protein
MGKVFASLGGNDEIHFIGSTNIGLDSFWCNDFSPCAAVIEV